MIVADCSNSFAALAASVATGAAGANGGGLSPSRSTSISSSVNRSSLEEVTNRKAILLVERGEACIRGDAEQALTGWASIPSLVYSNPRMVPILCTVFAGLIGLAFGSFLNVCLTRWPGGASVVRPRSKCIHCGRMLLWWENVPVLSWLALGGRCRTCKGWLGWRYPLVELAVGVFWAAIVWQALAPLAWTANDLAAGSHFPDPLAGAPVLVIFGKLLFTWLLVGLAVVDVEHLWLPDFVTLPGIVLGGLITIWSGRPLTGMVGPPGPVLLRLIDLAFDLAISAGLILLIRWLYWIVRRREGIGLGDAKLMAMLAAWLGLPGALLAFSTGVLLGALFGAIVLLVPDNTTREKPGSIKLPLGTFLCVGGLIALFYGSRILAAYLRWASLG